MVGKLFSLSGSDKMNRLALCCLVTVLGLLIGLKPCHAAEIFEEGSNYHVIGYEAGGLPDGTSVAMVVLRVETVYVSGQLKINTTVVDVLIDDGWSYEIVKSAALLGCTEVPVHVATGLSPEQIKAYR